MRRIAYMVVFLLTAVAATSMAQSRIVQDFEPACDSLAALLQERNTVAGELKLKAVMKRGTTLDFYFTETLGDYPWYKDDIPWFRDRLKELFPEDYGRYRLGDIYSRRVDIDRLATPVLGFSGNPSPTPHKVRKTPGPARFVTELGEMKFGKGLSGRNIALWQSHGRYYEQSSERWEWQRPCLFQTVEDMFTQGFVLPFLVPMLENAGAYVMLPRERDIQKHEIIADNDPCNGGRGSAAYEEKGRWNDAGVGFADTKTVYLDKENPFQTGTARQTECIPATKKSGMASITWRPEIPERGEYAVYVSYKSLPQSTSCANYTVVHKGGISRFCVNQKMGGGTWVYLGTFEFDKGTYGYVRLENRIPEGYRHTPGSIVTADGVKFGGGMGNIARNGSGKDSLSTVEPSISGMPRSAEAARYWLQWAGADSTVYSQNEGMSDYKDDFMSRGDWVEWMSRGSYMNPSKKQGLGIPVDLSFGFHSDAGVTPNDSIVGTLAIYTLKSEGRQTLPSGENRMTNREYADIVQSQIVNDMRECYDSLWSRRSIWDRAYRESRTPSSPAMLLELLSHQNFADMRYGLDPSFRFAASRAVYKGMLKYLSNRYGYQYAVQPLPVQSFGISFGKTGNEAIISWIPTKDPLEPTSEPTGYILQTRIDDGAFDHGIVIKDIRRSGERLQTTCTIRPGHIYSFRIIAFNEGGRSFPSETLSIGSPDKKGKTKKVLIVNNFDRVSAPAYFDTPSYAGFDNRLDSGVPYVRDITYVGEMYQFRRELGWTDDENPGFGASYTDYAGETVAGNTFDYPYVHGKAILEAGYPFTSCSNEAFCSDDAFMKEAWSVDLICGKQVTVTVGNGMQQKYRVFDEKMQKVLKEYTGLGGNVLVSGSNIGTDIWDKVYPIRTDSLSVKESKEFAEKVLGYRWMTNYAGRRGTVIPTFNRKIDFGKYAYAFHNTLNPHCYCVETPDGIVPASDSGATVMRYSDTNVSAGICHEGNGYRTVCLGFPIETLKSETDIDQIIRITLEFFEK